MMYIAWRDLSIYYLYYDTNLILSRVIIFHSSFIQ